MIYPNIADLLKSSRKALGLSVKEVIDKLATEGIQVSSKTLYGWESGHRQPDADTFVALCVLYGIPSFSQLAEKKDPSTPSNDGAEEPTLEEDIQLLTDLFVARGYIKPGEDLSDRDAAVLEKLIELLDLYFQGRN